MHGGLGPTSNPGPTNNPGPTSMQSKYVVPALKTHFCWVCSAGGGDNTPPWRAHPQKCLYPLHALTEQITKQLFVFLVIG